MYRVNTLLAAVSPPPIAEAHGWIKDRRFPDSLPLIDLAQAVPGYPPPNELALHLGSVAMLPAAHRYTEIEGIPALREALAADISSVYGATVAGGQVMITAGCNQAFCLAVMAVAGAGDEVILPLPYYFNHRMWLDMQGLRAVHLPFRPERGGVPDVADAARLIGPRTRAIVLVTPNNPTGAVYPPSALAAFHALARKHGLALIVDETYRDFLPADERAHGLFDDPDWHGTLIHLYSFSKVFSLTGHRVGAIVAGTKLIAEIAKAMDCVSICAPRLGQEAALYGLGHLADWRRANTGLMRERLGHLRQALARNDLGYELVSAGAYFAYLRHPFAGEPAARIARRLADEQNILCLPGSMFGPGQDAFLRFAFANVEADIMPAIAERLAQSAAAWR